MARPVVATLLAAVTAMGGFGLGLMTRSIPSSIPAQVDVTASVETVEVAVGGWVVSPGVVAVSVGSIVAEAVEAAGGLRPGALTDGINLAAPVFSGDQIVVPGPAESDVGTRADGLISLNGATASDLEALPGVGPVLAERIVAFRDQYGRFTEVEDLLQVPGIGEAKLASIRDLVRP